MGRLARVLCVAAWLLLPVQMMAEEDRLGPDYIRASLLVADPAAQPYAIFGHCALRLQCPSQQMDYCFTFEMSTSASQLLGFFRGTAMGAFKPAPTDAYTDYYRQEGRGLTEYELNLLPTEKLLLWRNADKEIARGFDRRYAYMHTQCASMLVSLVGSALEAPVSYGDLTGLVDGSFRDLMLQAAQPYPWSAFFWQTVMGPEGDATGPVEHKLVPQKLPAAWQQATVGSGERHLIVSPGRRIMEATPQADSCRTSPTAVFALALLLIILVSGAQRFRGWHVVPRIVDGILLALHTLAALLLLWMVLFSTQEGTGWNWYLLPFNPLPQLLWLTAPRWRRHTCRCFMALLLLTLVLTPCIPQLDLPHALLIACLAVRLTFYIRKNKYNQIKRKI